MITICIDEEDLICDLMERVEFWTDDSDTIKLFENMYENYVYNGYFDNYRFSVNEIVDNDYVNYTRIIGKGDDEYEKVKEFYDENGLGDCSVELNCCDFVEAEYNGMFLIR